MHSQPMPNPCPKNGPYDWNPFIAEVTTTCTDIQKGMTAVEKDIQDHPERRQQHLEQVDQMIDRIIEIQDMIDYEHQYIDQLTDDQRKTLESYKNLSLRLHQELSELRKKI
ncbi:unnamed protein product [Oppiella nova]|uniref:Uncharacterized protein n=1 Tax=Oppiella nova TaxID=334625 RepID=A0A7R9QP49_9ACAR|nr:unnamed protein product [Oppiella nova]CAG2170283.1 unnamed protein product [Oppiella nova]